MSLDVVFYFPGSGLFIRSTAVELTCRPIWLKRRAAAGREFRWLFARPWMRPNTYQPSGRQGQDLLRPVVEPRRRETASNERRVTGSVQCRLRFQCRLTPGCGRGSQHLLRLKLRGAKRKGDSPLAA